MKDKQLNFDWDLEGLMECSENDDPDSAIESIFGLPRRSVLEVGEENTSNT